LPDVEIVVIQVTRQMGILAAVQAVDFRNGGIDGLARIASQIHEYPVPENMSGADPCSRVKCCEPIRR
jgi:hypothetical protein